jgi:molybdenum cofactor synthesis domain-containing protein
MLRCSIVVIGDEILGGYVRDTNSGWLAERLAALGIPLDRIVTVPDDVEAVGDALAAELTRSRPRVVLTSGGIGSTPDDVTLEAIARHLGRDLVTEPSIDGVISRLVTEAARQGAPISPEHERSLRKMARVPDGAYLLPGAVGVAPGVGIDVDDGASADGGVTIAVLPGVPSELRRIMVQGVEPALLAGRGEPLHVVELEHSYPESTLNPVLDRIVVEFPDVHLGSYPGAVCVVRLRGVKDRTEQAAALVRMFLDGLDREIGAAVTRDRWRARWE